VLRLLGWSVAGLHQQGEASQLNRQPVPAGGPPSASPVPAPCGIPLHSRSSVVPRPAPGSVRLPAVVPQSLCQRSAPMRPPSFLPSYSPFNSNGGKSPH
jgi:hypothetical protein